MITRLPVFVVLGLLAGGIAAVGLHLVGPTSNLVARFASVAPFGILAALLAGILAAILRRWWLVTAAVIVVAAGVATQAPLYLGASSGRPAALTVMQANIYLGKADIDGLARTVDERGVDVLAVSELTDAALTRIEKSSIAARLPYSVTEPVAEGGAGTGLFSRFPLTGGGRLPGLRMANLRAETVVPGHGALALYALHPQPPWPEPAWRWELELNRLRTQLAAEPLPLVAAGDFNSTWDHAQLRRLVSGASLTDAAEHTGAGIVPTYPADRAFPAVLAIDRILTGGGAEPVSFQRVELAGSDHHGVVAGIAL